MRRRLLYAGIGLSAFLGFLLTNLPASLIWAQAKDQVSERLPALLVTRIDGTIWNGGADLSLGGLSASRVVWRLDSDRILAGGLPYFISVTGSGHRLAAQVTLTPYSLTITHLNGNLQPDYLNRLGAAFGLAITGDLNFTDLQFGTDRQWLDTASGRLNWAGGQVTFPDPTGAGLIELPPLQGQISLVTNNLRLDITYSSGDQDLPLISLLLKPEGWLEVAIKARLFKLAQRPWPPGIDLDETALALEEKLF